MGTIDDIEFERRGARGCGDSDYNLSQTSCCGAYCAEDVELNDLYLDATDLSVVISLLTTGNTIGCPFCGSEDWDLRRVEDLTTIPEEWRWSVG